jgi:hypothetical protein
MKTINKALLISAVMLTLPSLLFGQFTMDANLRPRTEIRKGTKDVLSVSNQKSVISTSQRTRLNLRFNSSEYIMKISLQDVRNWGSVSTLSNGANNNFDIHEAWAEIKLSENFSIKGGRQEVAYDDHRIMGNVGWAQQARSHDLGIIKFNGFVEAHLGLAYNSNNEVNGSYEKMNYLWIHKNFNSFKGSLMRLDKDDLVTLGGRLSTTFKEISINFNCYNQKNGGNLDAFLYGFDASYKLNNKFNIRFGFEKQSGADSKNLAFNPVFGTNHKFNGHMDYFYVGNHANSVGLEDKFISCNYKQNKFNLKMTYHIFNAVTEMDNNLDVNLGNEVDLSISYPFNKDINFSFGHSIYSATESMVYLKGGNLNEKNNWTYLMVSITPKLIQ